MSLKTTAERVAVEVKLRKGVARVSLHLLSQALHLPEYHQVLDVRPGPLQSGYFEILIAGPSLPEVSEAERIPEVDIQYSMELGEPVPEKKIIAHIEARDQ